VMVSVSGALSPGDPGTNSGIGMLTFDGANAAKSLIALDRSEQLAFDLGDIAAVETKPPIQTNALAVARVASSALSQRGRSADGLDLHQLFR